ncbi:hypothetical protein [Parafrankia discariae]|uniref:hypothetical protein n=1 Tax=Parafrankia discariae TaxID=365528 RepID=UPI001E519339|nr:hypothetical protein [Parafrankia discariae]
MNPADGPGARLVDGPLNGIRVTVPSLDSRLVFHLADGPVSYRQETTEAGHPAVDGDDLVYRHEP